MTEKEQIQNVLCSLVDCTNGDVRLVGGSTAREGRVEVCVDGRWGTVCNNNQEEIAEAVCSQLGFPAEGIRVTFVIRQYINCMHVCTRFLLEKIPLGNRSSVQLQLEC